MSSAWGGARDDNRRGVWDAVQYTLAGAVLWVALQWERYAAWRETW